LHAALAEEDERGTAMAGTRNETPSDGNGILAAVSAMIA
jgi:hypothetical protein